MNKFFFNPLNIIGHVRNLLNKVETLEEDQVDGVNLQDQIDALQGEVDLLPSQSEVDAKAAQTALDALQGEVDLLPSQSEVDAKAAQTALDALEARVEALENPA